MYRNEIKKDITHFGKTYQRAYLRVDIVNLNIMQAAHKVKDALDFFVSVQDSNRNVDL